MTKETEKNVAAPSRCKGQNRDRLIWNAPQRREVGAKVRITRFTSTLPGFMLDVNITLTFFFSKRALFFSSDFFLLFFLFFYWHCLLEGSVLLWT